jgi:hypothetical protein
MQVSRCRAINAAAYAKESSTQLTVDPHCQVTTLQATRSHNVTGSVSDQLTVPFKKKPGTLSDAAEVRPMCSYVDCTIVSTDQELQMLSGMLCWVLSGDKQAWMDGLVPGTACRSYRHRPFTRDLLLPVFQPPTVGCQA